MDSFLQILSLLKIIYVAIKYIVILIISLSFHCKATNHIQTYL